MQQPVPGPPAYYDWNGTRWYRNRKDHYYRDPSGGVLLHVAIWTNANGPAPDGHVIHHRDHNRDNNSIDNLQALADRDHRRHHLKDNKRWASAQTSEAAKARATQQWADREPTEHRCEHCGSSFWSTGMRAKFCHANCRAADRRARARERANGTRLQPDG